MPTMSFTEWYIISSSPKHTTHTHTQRERERERERGGEGREGSNEAGVQPNPLLTHL